MDVKKIIDKLELIKHLHLINMLEIYTEQFENSATTTPPPATTTPPPATTTTPPATTTTPPATTTTPPATTTTPPATTTTPPATTTTPPATTTTPPATTTTPPATTTTPPVKPVEETKKTTEFENNLMDSLKWVFIGIAIFVFILIILSVVYWLMFGSSNTTTSNTENTIREDDMNGMNGDVNGMNGEINPYPEVPESNIDNKETSIFSFSSPMSQFSNKVNEPIVEPIAEPIVEPIAEPTVEPTVEPIPVVNPVSIVPIKVIEEVKK